MFYYLSGFDYNKENFENDNYIITTRILTVLRFLFIIVDLNYK
jgi:hypothetical protein